MRKKARQTQDSLRSKRRTEPDYGKGEYTIPLEDVQKFLTSPRERNRLSQQEALDLLNKQEQKLMDSLRENANFLDYHKNDPEKSKEITESMKSIARKLIVLRDRKKRFNRVSSLIRKFL